MAKWVSILRNLRWTTVIIGLSNLILIILGLILMVLVYPDCYAQSDILIFLLILVASCVKIAAMIRTGIAQKETAMMILNYPSECEVLDTVIRHERRISYKRWLWWTRFVLVVTVLQFLGAAYLMFVVAKHLSHNGTSVNCVIGIVSHSAKWQKKILILFLVVVCYVALIQCFAGSDVLRWRSFYTSKDNAWKAHYREVFDHGIREALCCMGRVKYLSVLEEDEVYSVAQLLGDLVTYRASGTGHLEFLAGLALLQKHGGAPISYEGYMEVPEDRIHEAAAFHQFAEAAYTGLLLDIGRNPVLFPCAWLYRQGVLTPWTRKRVPVLEGDNWWQGHAAAFLKYDNLAPESLRRGRVNQAKCKAAYFIVVLHHLKSVVIAVRGTETPEDLITDGLCRECTLTAEDLDGLINGNHIPPDIRQAVILSSPHYGHSGIVEAARDLFIQIEGNPKPDGGSERPSENGFLSSLLGAGCECEGYGVRIVGHSLGGSIAAFLGLRLYSRYPNLHVYAYGSLPCVDSIVADACSEFVTSIVHDNEFSSRLSVASILRLRADAIMTLSQDAGANSSIISKLIQGFLFVSSYQKSKDGEKNSASDLNFRAMITEDANNHQISRSQGRNGRRVHDEEFSFWEDAQFKNSSRGEINSTDLLNKFTNPLCESFVSENPFGGTISDFTEATSSGRGLAEILPEMFLPGLVIHIVPQKNHFHLPIWKSWRTKEKGNTYRAYVAKREAFKDIIVAPSMFLDHLPWRCNYAMKKVLEMRNARALQDESQMV